MKRNEIDMATDELEGMPAPRHRVKVIYKVDPVTRFVDDVPDLGDPVAYPDLSLGFVTKVVHSHDRDGELWAITVEVGE